MSNLYKRFSYLFGRSLRTVGTCIAADFGECTIQYPGGGTVRVRGAGTVGQAYYVFEGRLDGEASLLPYLELEI